MKKSILLLFAFFYTSTFTFAQLNEVIYTIDYNETTDLFDCKMYVTGTATSAMERLQIGGKYSIVTETGTTLTVAESYFPIYNNETYTGTIPTVWNISNTAIDPSEFPGYDVFEIVPEIGGQPSHYNNISWEDEITLFSLVAEGDNICNLSLRVFENDDDPNIIGGIDYSNTMMIGTANEIYIGNEAANGIQADIDISINDGSVCIGECITLTAEFNCIFPGMTYEWETGETTQSITVCPDGSSEYILHLSGPFEFSSEVTTFINVDEGIITAGITDLCVGEQVEYYPENGIWSSNDESIVTVTNEGLLIALAQGSAIISHTNSAGFCLEEVAVNVLDPEPPQLVGTDEICVDDVTQLIPNSGVTWSSGNEAVATIDDTGLVTGVGLGVTVFTYTTDQGQCTSEQSQAVTVFQIPEPIITGLDSICVGVTTTLTPQSGVIWVSADPSIATIDNSGNVTGVSGGSTTFVFTDMANGCTSDESEPVTVLPAPEVELSTYFVCQGESVIATSNVDNGSWVLTAITVFSTPPTIDVTSGEITTNEAGTIAIQYVGEGGCISDSTVTLIIIPNPIPQVSTNSPVCIGENLILSVESSTDDDLQYTWSLDGNFVSFGKAVIVPDADEGDAGLYTLSVGGIVCFNEVSFDVIVEDCDPCEDGSSTTSWTKVPASTDAFTSIGDYEVGGSLVSGRDLEDFVYYNKTEEDVRLIKNNGDGLFEEEVVLFDLPAIGKYLRIDVVDIDQDGLSEIITYQPELHSATNDGDTVTINIFQNLDNYIFENRRTLIKDPGLGYITYPIQYEDIDNQGFLDIVPIFGAIHFMENWEDESIDLPVLTNALWVNDINEDGLLDILGRNNQLFLNNGDRTFSTTTVAGDQISSVGLYDEESGVYTNGYETYQITKGDNPEFVLCNEFSLNDPFSFFFANINSSSVENGVINANWTFQVFDRPFTCENTSNYNSIFDFLPNEDGKIDINGNGFSDFITVEEDRIFVWVNPNDKPKVRGTAFIDNNGDGMLNENDSPLRNVLISIEPGNLSVLTDNTGNYQFAVSEGTYTLTANVNEGEWVLNELTIENIEINEPCNLGFDFGFKPDPTPIPSVNLSMVNTITRCDFEVKFTITVENTGTEPFGSQLQFEFDDKASFFSTEIAGATVVGNKVIADIGPLTPFQPQKYEIKVKMPSGSSVLPILGFKATLLNDAEEVIAEYGYEEQLRCSYDPNDKREFPDRVGDDNLTLMDEDIEYTIRFQNNGNDTAYTVRIVDPLDNNIDPSSIRVVGSSHRVETCIEETNLIFLFENIFLVDSMTNYPGSQGYVTFKCNAKEGRAEFTKVNNSAEIYFDTNLPIVTNQTINTLVSELCTDKSTVLDMYICDGEEYMGHTESGTYTESFDLLFGCDSLVTINLTVQGITYSQQLIDVCGSAEVTIGDEEYFIDSSTTIIDTVINDQGCISNVLKYKITVVSDLIEIDELKLCINEIGSVPTNLDGLWSVDNEEVIILDDQGNITTVNSGIATLQFLDDASGCIDEIQVEVLPEPEVNNEGSDEICINEMNQLNADTNGTWVSSDPAIATITNDGMVLGLGEGTVIFMFTSLNSGCTNSIALIVLPPSDSNCLVSTADLSSQSVKVFPNPATESLFIESEDAWSFARVFNSQGQVVLSIGNAEYERKKHIDLKGVVSGLYFVAIEIQSGVVVRKVVVD